MPEDWRNANAPADPIDPSYERWSNLEISLAEFHAARAALHNTVESCDSGLRNPTSNHLANLVRTRTQVGRSFDKYAAAVTSVYADFHALLRSGWQETTGIGADIENAMTRIARIRVRLRNSRAD
jgi:hypothetical protein